MKITKILTIFIFVVLAYSAIYAQTNTITFFDPSVVRYVIGGFAKNTKIHIATTADYSTLNLNQKQNILSKVSQDFEGYDVIVYPGGQERELWMTDGKNLFCVEIWNNDSLDIEHYMPLELNRTGDTKVFYYVGGTFSGSDSYSNGSLNLRVGSFLYKNIIDASGTVNIGYNKTNGNSQFAGDIGIDSRAYLPFRIKNINLAPYAGAGISYSFSPNSYFELRFLTGTCWFLGLGSLDLGLQYGTKSSISLSLGYTFRFSRQKRIKK